MGISRLIYGRAAMVGLHLLPDAWYADNRITCWLNTRATNIDRQNREVRLGTGESLHYDRLILATGSAAFVPPLHGWGLRGTFVLRAADDALRIRSYAQRTQARRAAVAGGGLLGLEAAYAMHKLGLRVTVLERGPCCCAGSSTHALRNCCGSTSRISASTSSSMPNQSVSSARTASSRSG